MDGRRFDDLVRSLSIHVPRRRLGVLAAGLLAAAGGVDALSVSRRGDGPSEAGRDKTCTPAGGACASVMSAKSKPRACCDGLTCVDNRCALIGGCPSGFTDCDGKCIPANSCCPACSSSEYCDDGYCGSLGCNDRSLASCLSAVSRSLGDTSATCRRACRDAADPGCRSCLATWLSDPQRSPMACYANACKSHADAAGPRAPLSCSYGELSSCIREVSDEVLRYAVDEVLDAPIRESVSELQDCLRSSRCGPMLETLSRNVWRDRGVGEEGVMRRLANCESKHGCLNGDGHCTPENLCCSPGQEPVNGRCCYVDMDGECQPDSFCRPPDIACSYPGLGTVCCRTPQICGAQSCECANGGMHCETDAGPRCCPPGQTCIVGIWGFTCSQW